MTKPYLLAPCGSIQALHAAVAAGADECYFGGNALNARMNAKGFTDEEFAEGLKYLRLHGVRSNITLNTLVFDREMDAVLEFAKKAHSMGADSFIVQDLGLAKRLQREIPGVELHASTQCACHNLDGAKKLSELGFSRIVLARELSFEDISKITEYGKGIYETEIFVHGALCVSHSGMCLMSSVIGGRSGNRGLCAQPCRMCGELENCKGKSKSGLYPLSLRDLSLSQHIKEILPLGISSLKIEGRMKSPEYVYRTTKILRSLIDENKNADEENYRELSEIFSRGGSFTDGYFTQKYLKDNRGMYGFRSENDKGKTAEAGVEIPQEKKIPAEIYVRVKKNEKPYVKLCARGKEGEYSLENPPSDAKNAPLTRELLIKNISKLGSTPFVAEKCTADLDDGLFLTTSEINALRRGAAENLVAEFLLPSVDGITEKLSENPVSVLAEKRSCGSPKLRFFTDRADFTPDTQKYTEEIESICLPLELFREGKELCEKPSLAFGVRLPRVIFEAEYQNVKKALDRAKDFGAKYVYVSNIGHIELAKETGLEVCGGIGLNVTNTDALLEYAGMGLNCISFSAELSCAQMRDILRAEGVRCAAVCEGRLPLMVLESCVLRANGLCQNSDGACSVCGEYTDRIGKKFKIYPERRFTDKKGDACRNIILNADVLRLYDKKDELRKCGAEVLEVYVN